ncbi:MAG: hypothetical protein RLZZ21_1101 [Planctomycetota bacterium]
MRPPDPLPGVEVRPRMLHLAHVQPVGPVVIGRVDVVRRADYPHAGVHRRLEELAGLHVVAIESARLLGDDQVPSLRLDAGPDLIDACTVGDLAADLGLLDDLNRDLRGLGALGQAGIEEGPAGGDLVVDTRLPLLLCREPSVDQDAKLAALRQLEGLSEVHHDAPPFAADAGTTAGPRAPRKPRAERATLSGMAPEDFAETLLKGPDFAQIGPLRPNTSQRSQVVVGHGHCVRNRRKSETGEKRPERIPPSPFEWMAHVPRRELSRPQQIVDWLVEWGDCFDTGSTSVTPLPTGGVTGARIGIWTRCLKSPSEWTTS